MTSPSTTFLVPTAGQWSGGGSSVLANFRHAARHHPQLRFDDGDVVIINRNFSRHRDSRPRIIIPQNAWAWSGPKNGTNERCRVAVLRTGAEFAMRRALGVVRVSRSIPPIGHYYDKYVPNPLDPHFDEALLESTDLQPPVTNPYFVTVGSMYGYRGVESVVTAFSLYRNAGGRTDLHIVGGGNRSYIAKIASMAANVPGVSLHPDAVARPMCLAWTRHARAAVLPSHVEASPFSLLEALAVQQRVLASDIAGHHDIVPPGMPGPRFFRHADPLTLTRLFQTSDACSLEETQHPLADASVRERARLAWGETIISAFNELAAGHGL